MYTPRSLAQTFYTEIMGKFDLELAHQLIHTNYIQHNPHLKTGREGVLEALSYLKAMPHKPRATSPIQLIIEEGPYAVVFLLLEIAGQPTAVMDLFRIEANQLVEHWDCIQTLDRIWELPNSFPSDSLNKYPSSNKERTKNLFLHLSQGDLVDSVPYFSHDPNLFYATKIQEEESGVESFWNHELSQFTDWELHQLVEEGGFVFVQSSATRDGNSYVGNDLLLWEKEYLRTWIHLTQEIPPQMRHENGMI